MSTTQAISNQAPGPSRNLLHVYKFLLVLCVGAIIGTVVALASYGTKISYAALLPIGLAMLLPPLLMKDFRSYWFVVFLLSLQFTISKNLNDGPAIIQSLHIDYTIFTFTFEITITDLVLMVLLAIWANDWIFHRKPVRFPRITWLAVIYLIVCLISIVGTASPFLGLVEMSRQIRFFIAYLFAVNCLNTKSAIRGVAVVGVIILATQGIMTIGRFETGFMNPLTLGDTHQDLDQIKEYLTVDRSDPASAVRAFGTLGSPGSTIRLCMMVIPFALFLCVRNPMYGKRPFFLLLTGLGILGLVFTFTRAYYVTTAFQLALTFLLMLRERMLKRSEIALVVLLGMGALAVTGHKLYYEFTVREDSVSVRLLQYEATAKMILDHPLLGVGLNNGTGEKQKYNNTTYNAYDSDTQFDREPTHNMYLSLASEIGIVGALIFVAFFAHITLLAWQQSYRSADPELRMVANALVVAFCSVAVTGLMDPVFESSTMMLLWLYAGITLNLPAMAHESSKETRPRAPGPVHNSPGAAFSD